MDIDVTRVRVEAGDFIRAMRNLTPAQQVGCVKKERPPFALFLWGLVGWLI